MIDSDYAARRNAFFAAFTITDGVLTIISPDTPACVTAFWALIAGLGMAIGLHVYQNALDYLMEALEKRRARKLALANREEH